MMNQHVRDNENYLYTGLPNMACGGRITAATGEPASPNNQTAKTTIYFTPYTGNRIALFDGTSAWNTLTFSELSLSLGSDAANTPYDLFAFNNSGAVAIERLAWTNDTTRATAIIFQDGTYVKSGATTRRYLGTYRTTGTVGQTEDSTAKRYIWNYYNRLSRHLKVVGPSSDYNYNTASWRQANNDATNQVDIVVGLPEVVIDLNLRVVVTMSGTSGSAFSGIGEDSTSGASADFFGSFAQGQIANPVAATGRLVKFPAIGRHFYAWNEFGGGTGTTTWSGTTAAGSTGINGWIEG